jgi:CHAD domain-containing protein
MHKDLRLATASANTAKRQHRTRILAKHLRYSIEMLRDVLPRKHAEKWYLEASNLQSRLGRTRDLLRASTLAEELQVSSAIAEHLQSIVNDRTGQA